MRALIAVLSVVVIALAGSWAWTHFGLRSVQLPEELRGPDASARVNAGAEVPAQDRVIRVQVLNGTREGGMGTRMASYLREGGFHVIEVKNADRSDYFATLVVARRDDPSAARAVARYLGSPPVILQTRGGDPAEVTLIIGSDRSRVRMEP
jgi:hypothetical protein